MAGTVGGFQSFVTGSLVNHLGALMSESKSTALVLRACTSEMTSRGGFVWPGVGGVATAPDWRDDSECGHGLHGWLYGQGDHTVSNLTGDPTAKWLVVEVEESTIRMLGCLLYTSPSPRD